MLLAGSWIDAVDTIIVPRVAVPASVVRYHFFIRNSTSLARQLSPYCFGFGVGCDIAAHSGLNAFSTRAERGAAPSPLFPSALEGAWTAARPRGARSRIANCTRITTDMHADPNLADSFHLGSKAKR